MKRGPSNRPIAEVDREFRPGKVEHRIADLRSRIAAETDCAKAVELLAMADTLEEAMANAGYRRNTEALRPVNEIRFEARWKLGQLLAKLERGSGPGRGKKMSQSATSFRAYLKEIGLQKDRASECQRIGAIPDEPKLKKAFEERAREGVLNTVQSMFLFARPFWSMKVRATRHRAIRDAAVAASSPLDKFGPFSLIYADPPTRFETYGEGGSFRSSQQHYPTLSWEEIENFTVQAGAPVRGPSGRRGFCPLSAEGCVASPTEA